MNLHYPAIGICGYSGSGKTTVILELVRLLTARGLMVGVIKHDTHGIDIDREGKDSDRMFRAGADVLIGDPTQLCLRLHRRGEAPLEAALRQMAPHVDLILVEGHKTTPLPDKVWLCDAQGSPPPPEATGIGHVLPRAADRVAILMALIDSRLEQAQIESPLYAGILIGGQSSRMGRPKHLLDWQGKTWLECAVAAVQTHVGIVVLLGEGEIPDRCRALPRLPDAGDAAGPLRGMRAAMRWAPSAAWVFLPCDTPLVSGDAIRWLLGHRRPGIRAVLPRRAGGQHVEPLPGFYDFRAAPLLECVDAPSALAGTAGVAIPEMPPALAPAWRNVNTPADARLLRAGT